MRNILLFILLFVLSETIALGQGDRDYLAQGNDLIQKGKFKNAIQLFTKAIDKDDRNAAYYLKRGVAYRNDKQFLSAFKDFSAAIHINDKYSEAYSERAKISCLAREFQECLNDLEMAIKYSPNDSLQHLYILARGGIRLSVRNYKGGFEDCKAFYAYDSTSREALINMAMAKLELNDPNVALEYLFRVIANHPKDTVALMNIGYVNIRLEKYDTALIYLEKARALDPNGPYTLNNISYAKLKLGDLRGAMKNVNMSLKIFPGNSYAYRNRALINLEMGDNEKACLDLRAAIKNGFTEEYGREVLDLIEKNCTNERKK